MSTMNKYSNAMWAQILGSFTAKDIAEYRRQFNLFDDNKNGHIEPDELKKLAKSLDMKLSDEEIMEMVKVCDFDNNGTIEFDEFLQMVFAINFGEGLGQFAEIYRKATGAEPVTWQKPELTYTPEEIEATLKQFAWFSEAEAQARETQPEVGEYPRFVWTAELHGVGYAHIDEEHKKLFQIVDDLETMLRQNGTETQLADALDGLLAYTDYHFKSEQAEMVKYNYPQKEAHAKIHQAFTQKMIDAVNDLKVKLTQNKEDVFDKKVIWETIYFLRNWLVNHIEKEDTVFGKYCTEAKAKLG